MSDGGRRAENIWDDLNQRIGEIVLGIFSWNVRRIDTRRFYPLFVITLLIAVTISHEAYYAGSFEQPGFEFIGWPYAIAMNLSILVSEYFTRWKTTRKWAWRSFYVVSTGSGAMNVAYIRPWVFVGMDGIFAWIYAVMPTVIIVLLGFLSSNVAELAGYAERRWEREEHKYSCFCGESFEKPIQLAGHTRKHIAEINELDMDSPVQILGYLKAQYPDSGEYPSIATIKRWMG